MKKLLKPFKRHSREYDDNDGTRSKSETRARRSESDDQHPPDVDSAHNIPIKPSTAAIAPAHPAVAVNGSGIFMSSNDLIAANAPRQSKSPNLGGDQKYMTEPHRRRFSEDVADRNLSTRTPDKATNGSVNGRARRSTEMSRKAIPGSVAGAQSLITSNASSEAPNASTEAVAASRAASDISNGQVIRLKAAEGSDRQPTRSVNSTTGFPPAKSSAVRTEIPPSTLPIRKSSLSKKALNSNSSVKSGSAVSAIDDGPTSHSQRLKSTTSADATPATTISSAPAVQPPSDLTVLPKVPLTEPLFANQTSRNAPFVPDASPITSPPVKRIPTDVRLPDGFSLQDSVDVDRSTTHAPAVTHEVVQPTVHHIRHEIITREIHTHDVYHRILPIVDVRILPARHYILDDQNDFKLKEVPACCVPGRTNDEHRSWTILETCSKFPELWNKDRKAPVERVGSKFTARTFGEKEGDTLEWVGADGVHRSERTWIHPPVSSSWGREYGGTEPLNLDEFAPSPEIPYDLHTNGITLKDMTVFDPSTVHERSFEETPELRHINGRDIIADRTDTHNPTSQPTVVSRNTAERLRLVDDSFDDSRRESSRIETINAGMTGIAS